MNSDTWMQVTLGQSVVRVPVIQDPATTEKIAAQITKKLIEVENNASRIDTLYFFQLTAFYMAAALYQSNHERDQDTREIMISLDKMHSKLQSLLVEFTPEKPAIIPFPDPKS